MSQIISNLNPTLDIFPKTSGLEAAVCPPATEPLIPTSTATSTSTKSITSQLNQALDARLPLNLAPGTLSEDNPLVHAVQSKELCKELSEADFSVDWAQHFDEAALDRLVTVGFMVLDGLFSPSALLALQTESGFISYRDARVSEGILVKDIRGDRIRWISDQFIAGFYYLQSINTLAHYFNRALYAGIRHSEAHYACYPPGFGYQWHTDNPKGRDERVLSAVYYLNDAWMDADGGALAIIDNLGHEQHILPKANRLVVFDSDLRHQVEIAHRQRYSIATWLRRDDAAALVR